MSSGKFTFDLDQVFKKRGLDVLKNFEERISSGITNPDILKILEDVKDYWNGKRGLFRPALISLACEAVGGKSEDTYEVGLMVTLAGAGVGIHDDITDRSKRKHWQTTVFGRYKLDDSLIVGDLLIVKGLSTIKDVIKKIHNPEKISNLIQTYQDFFFNSYEGMFMEKVCRKNVEVEINFYHEILQKYASDVQACAKLGAILGGGTEKEIQVLSEYGLNMGYAYRLCEDVKDTLNIEGVLINRLRNESVPLPILYAAKRSEKYCEKIKKILSGPIETSDITPLLTLCFKTEAFKYIRNLIKEQVTKGVTILSSLKKSEAKQLLILLIKKQQDNLMLLNKNLKLELF